MEWKTKELANRFEQAEKELKSANALKALLGDALDYIEASTVENCPVCERSLQPGGVGAVRERAKKLSDETTHALERAKADAREAADAHEKLKRVRSQLVDECNDLKRRLDKVRADALTALGGSGVTDAKMAARLEETSASKTTSREMRLTPFAIISSLLS